jgi:hypothetical protein
MVHAVKNCCCSYLGEVQLFDRLTVDKAPAAVAVAPVDLEPTVLRPAHILLTHVLHMLAKHKYY